MLVSELGTTCTCALCFGRLHTLIWQQGLLKCGKAQCYIEVGSTSSLHVGTSQLQIYVLEMLGRHPENGTKRILVLPLGLCFVAVTCVTACFFLTDA